MAPHDPPELWTDERLVDGCVRGAAAAWKEVTRRYGSIIYGIARRFRLSPEDCVDAYSQVCIILLENLHQLRDASRLPGYISTTAYRVCLAIVRENDRYRDVIDPDTVLEPVTDGSRGNSDEVVRAVLRALKVRRAIEQMEPRCRKLLQALFFDPDEPDYRQVAAQMGMPVASIGPTRQRCLEKMKRLLEEFS